MLGSERDSQWSGWVLRNSEQNAGPSQGLVGTSGLNTESGGVRLNTEMGWEASGRVQVTGLLTRLLA